MTEPLDPYCSDAEWFAETGNCGACGSPVEPVAGMHICTCTECGCGPHPPLTIGLASIPHEQPDLFGGAA